MYTCELFFIFSSNLCFCVTHDFLLFLLRSVGLSLDIPAQLGYMPMVYKLGQSERENIDVNVGIQMTFNVRPEIIYIMFIHSFSINNWSVCYISIKICKNYDACKRV